MLASGIDGLRTCDGDMVQQEGLLARLELEEPVTQWGDCGSEGATVLRVGGCLQRLLRIAKYIRQTTASPGGPKMKHERKEAA